MKTVGRHENLWFDLQLQEQHLFLGNFKLIKIGWVLEVKIENGCI